MARASAKTRGVQWSMRLAEKPFLFSVFGPADQFGAVAGLVGIEDGVVSGVINLESSGVETPDWRPRHDKEYHEA